MTCSSCSIILMMFLLVFDAGGVVAAGKEGYTTTQTRTQRQTNSLDSPLTSVH